MKKFRPYYILLFGATAVPGLSGCEQVENAAHEALHKAKQSAGQVLEDARQSGSVEQARQSASEALTEARQAASVLLGEASEYLDAVPREPEPGSPATEDSPEAR